MSKPYIINVISRHEKDAMNLIYENAFKLGESLSFSNCVIPVERAVDFKKGKKINIEKRLFPGYIMFNISLNTITWHIVNDTRYVLRILGNCRHTPSPISKIEEIKILTQAKEGQNIKELEEVFKNGQYVKILAGSFATFNGFVEEVDDIKGRLKVLVSIFGRKTPLDLPFNHVEISN